MYLRSTRNSTLNEPTRLLSDGGKISGTGFRQRFSTATLSKTLLECIDLRESDRTRHSSVASTRGSIYDRRNYGYERQVGFLWIESAGGTYKL